MLRRMRSAGKVPNCGMARRLPKPISFATNVYQTAVHKALHVRLKCEPVAPETLPRYELKTKRIIDQRPKEFRRALDR
jgi:phenylacetate-coenzyme A ligase PaaK-like adenylate-forming protein